MYGKKENITWNIYYKYTIIKYMEESSIKHLIKVKNRSKYNQKTEQLMDV